MTRQQHRTIRLATTVPPEIAAAYQRAARIGGKSVSQAVREALEDQLASVRAAADIGEDLAAGRTVEAAVRYQGLANAMLQESVQALAEATLLEIDAVAASVEKSAADLAHRADEEDRDLR